LSELNEGGSVEQQAAKHPRYATATVKRHYVTLEIRALVVAFRTRNKPLNSCLKIRKLCRCILDHETVMAPSKMCIPKQCVIKPFIAFVFKLPTNASLGVNFG
jgi:hypothetical protein